MPAPRPSRLKVLVLAPALVAVAMACSACESDGRVSAKHDAGRHPDIARPNRTLTWVDDVAPIIAARGCAHSGCHDARRPAADYSLSSYEAALADEMVMPFVPDSSPLYLSVKEGSMPPPAAGAPLTDGEVEVIRAWIADGALETSRSLPRRDAAVPRDAAHSDSGGLHDAGHRADLSHRDSLPRDGSLHDSAARDAAPRDAGADLSRRGDAGSGHDGGTGGTYQGVTFTAEEAHYALAICNRATISTLLSGVHLTSPAAESIVRARPIADLATVARLLHIGPSALLRIRAYVPIWRHDHP